jgi:hypothetical protein
MPDFIYNLTFQVWIKCDVEHLLFHSKRKSVYKNTVTARNKNLLIQENYFYEIKPTSRDYLPSYILMWIKMG